jgi:guanylate kinase
MVCGAMGSGKTTMASFMLEQYSGSGPLLSTTTRKPRPTDIEYEYVNHFKFRVMKALGTFAWTTNVRGEWYGTRKAYIEKARRSEGYTVALLVVEKALELKSMHPQDVAGIYLQLSECERERRMRGRGDSEEAIQKSLSESRTWDERARDLKTEAGVPVFDYFIDNSASPCETFGCIFLAVRALEALEAPKGSA